MLFTILEGIVIKLPKLISDGMILQRDSEVKIWGWAPVGERVKIEFLNKEYRTITDKDGHWMVILSPMKAGGPYQMMIEDSYSSIFLKDILIGDVWLCSGQSNMQLPMERVKDLYKGEIASAENPNLRLFNVPLRYDFNKPQLDLEDGCWESVDSDSILRFTAVGYFFAKTLYEKYQIPIGIINASQGGTPIEAWLSEGVLKRYPEYMAEIEKYKDGEYIETLNKKEEKACNNWFRQIDENDPGLSDSSMPWYEHNLETSDWQTMKIPGSFNKEGLLDFKGSIWFRKKIEIPDSLAGKPARLWLGRIVDSDKAYVNGEFVGNIEYQYPPRKYCIPEGLLKEGENTITVRVIANNGQGEFVEDKPYKLIVGDENIDLTGEWYYRIGTEVSEPFPELTFIEWKPMGLFNGMINPLTNYTIKGVNWYQGESNTGDSIRYEELFPELIKNWRKKWGLGDFPFLYVQLPNYGRLSKVPVESEWAEMREAQLKALSVENTAMVVAIDLGEWNDLHPLNKKDVGYRLALAAQYKAYGEKDVGYSGPIYQSMKIEGNKAIISFTHTGQGLTIRRDNKLKGFTIEGAEDNFLQAEARINGDEILVWNDQIQEPRIVRYAWADNPEANLYNKDGLPASPFRTD